MVYVDELRIGSRYVVNIPDSIRSKLNLYEDGSIIFYSRTKDLFLKLFSFDEKKEVMSKGSGDQLGEYLGDSKIDSKWNFYLTDSLRKKLAVEIGDYMILYQQGEEIKVVVEKYSERKKRRETQCKK